MCQSDAPYGGYDIIHWDAVRAASRQEHLRELVIRISEPLEL
jgi:hypothetical protein